MLRKCCILLFICTLISVLPVVGADGIVNGTFSDDLSGWGVSGCTGTVEDGVLCLSGSTAGYAAQKVIRILPGHTYTLSASMRADTGASPAMKIEWGISRGDWGALNLGGTNKYYTATSAFQTVALTATAPPYADHCTVMLRKLGTSGNVYWDAVTLTGEFGDTPQEETPSDGGTMEMETDCTFYYTDETGAGTATATAPAGTTKVTYTLSEGTQTLLTATKAPGESFSYPLSLLTKTKTAYTVSAFAKNGNTEMGSAVRHIYKYARAGNLQSDGKYRADGAEMLPVMMYTVPTSAFSYMSEIGVNVVQAYPNATTLEAAEAAGIKLLCVLYSGMLPAGHPDNMRATRYIVETYKNHPAVFAWAIMDEPYYGLRNEETADVDRWLRDSYRIVREIDDTHPVFVTEDAASRYGKTARFSDILCIDPYPGTSVSYTKVYTYTAAAAAATDKPVYVLTQSYQQGSYLPSAQESRHMLYEACLGGAKGLGFYQYWNGMRDSALWAGLTDVAVRDLPKMASLGTFTVSETNSAYAGTDGDHVLALAKQDTNAAFSVQTDKTPASVCGGGTAYQRDGQFCGTVYGGNAALYDLKAEKTDNMLLGGDFSDAAKDAWMPANDVSVENGKLVVRGSTFASCATQVLVGIPAGDYRLSFLYMNEEHGAEGYCPNIRLTMGAYEIDMTGWTSMPAPGGTSARYTVYFRVPQAAPALMLKISGASKGPYLFDDFVLQRIEGASLALWRAAECKPYGANEPADSRIRRHMLSENGKSFYPVKVRGEAAGTGDTELIAGAFVSGETAKARLIAAVYTDGTFRELSGVYVLSKPFSDADDRFLRLPLTVGQGASVKLFLITDDGQVFSKTQVL